MLAGLAMATHAKVVPTIFEVKATAADVLPEQIVCCSGLLVTVGAGSTFTVYIAGVPGQLDGAGPIGVIVYVTIADVRSELKIWCVGRLPVPEGTKFEIPAGAEPVH